MRNLFDEETAADIRARIGRLTADSPRQWGTMNAPQVVEHCARGLEMATGDVRPPRLMIGRLLGWGIKRLALGNENPLRRNSPTMPELIVADPPDLAAGRQRLIRLLDQFVTKGRAACTTHPHSFFGRLTPDEWGVLMYKHLDHHLRQFGA